MGKKFYVNLVLAGIIVGLSAFSAMLYGKTTALRHELNNNYSRAFYDMVGYVENIKTIITKTSVCTTCPKKSNLLEEIWHKANMAQENLNLLPVQQETLKSTSKYLNQVGDFAYSLNKQSLVKKDFTKEEYDKLQKLQIYSEVLTQSLQKLGRDINEGKVRWDKLKRVNKNMKSIDYLHDVEKNFQDYPTLIYDGPFSDHINKVKPKALTGKNISVNEAKNKVKEFLDYKDIETIKQIGVTKGNIETYNFEAKLKGKEDRIYVDVTKIGGHIYSMMYNKEITASRLDMESAKGFALKFLQKKGYTNMKDTYYLKEDNQAIINYATKQDNVVCYPDLMKVKVALDTGEIIGFEARGYITSHIKRDFSGVNITMEDAKKIINNDVEIISSNMAVIPTELKTEVLTYEFKGKLNQNDFLVYVNAKTGEVENILMIIDTPNGVLTM